MRVVFGIALGSAIAWAIAYRAGMKEQEYQDSLAVINNELKDMNTW